MPRPVLLEKPLRRSEKKESRHIIFNRPAGGLNLLSRYCLAGRTRLRSGYRPPERGAAIAAVTRLKVGVRAMTETTTVTVLFTDVVGSTRLRQHQGETAAHEIMNEHNEIVRRQIGEHAGQEVKTGGDSFMVAFDSARKGVECAVSVQRALHEYNCRHPAQPVKVRIGLHTGEAIRAGNDLFGTSVDAAARIMAQADGEQILVSDVLKSILGAAKDLGFKDHKRVRLKGFAERWRLWEVTWRSESEAVASEAIATGVASGTGRTPFVGRSEERSLLRQAMSRAIAGGGGVALVAGEAGLGKTRLVDEIAAEAKASGMFVVRGHCYDMEGSLPYVPFVEAIEYGLTVTTQDVFRSAMGDAGPEIARFVPKVRVAYPDLPPPLALPSDQARHYMFESVCDFFERAAAIQPLLIVLEDLHWADESTTQLLESVARRVGRTRLLMIGTYRDVDLHPGHPFMRGIEHLSRLQAVLRITLKRLSAIEVAGMLRGLSGQNSPERLVRLIFDETEGVPFFVEEVYRHLAEEHRLTDAAGKWLPQVEVGEVEVPETVRLVLGRRIDRIGETAQRILTTAACIGRTFTFEFLTALARRQRKICSTPWTRLSAPGCWWPGRAGNLASSLPTSRSVKLFSAGCRSCAGSACTIVSPTLSNGFTPATSMNMLATLPTTSCRRALGSGRQSTCIGLVVRRLRALRRQRRWLFSPAQPNLPARDLCDGPRCERVANCFWVCFEAARQQSTWSLPCARQQNRARLGRKWKRCCGSGAPTTWSDWIIGLPLPSRCRPSNERASLPLAG